MEKGVKLKNRKFWKKGKIREIEENIVNMENKRNAEEYEYGEKLKGKWKIKNKGDRGNEGAK